MQIVKSVQQSNSVFNISDGTALLYRLTMEGNILLYSYVVYHAVQ